MNFKPLHLAAVLATMALGACTTTEEAQQVIQSRWIGQPVDNFFMRYGPPVSNYAMGNGGQIYTWRGGEKERYVAPIYSQARDQKTTVTTGAGQSTTIVTPGRREMIAGPRVDSLVCEVQITTDPGNRIMGIRATNDTDGAGMSLSRCAEVLDVASR